MSTSPSETPRSRGSHPNVPSRVRPDSSSSLEIHQRTPLHRIARLASTPSRTEARPSAPGHQARHTFRPCLSTRLRRFAPRGGCGSIAPRFRPWGSPCFQLYAHAQGLPRRRLLPSEAFPSLAAGFDVSTVPTLSPLSRHCAWPCCHNHRFLTFPDHRVLLHQRIRCVPLCCHNTTPDASLGFPPA